MAVRFALGVNVKVVVGVVHVPVPATADNVRRAMAARPGTKIRPRVEGDPLFGNSGFDFDQVRIYPQDGRRTHARKHGLGYV